MSSPITGTSPSIKAPVWIQGLAWGLGIGACVLGMMDRVAQWDPDVARIQLLCLVAGPIIFAIERYRPRAAAPPRPAARESFYAWSLAILVGLTSWTICYLVGRGMQELPPAYHDEYSYVFQAKTLLMGHFSTASHPTQPQLFDQMHVLNEGRMASRYYPGTGLWLAPFLSIGRPYWGYWLASALTSVLVFWTGYELGRLRVAVVSGLVCAVSPGIALFSNLLLAHQPTLVSLSLFVWAFVKWQRTLCRWDALVAGTGLAFAMLCRPMTAAGIGLPFGLIFLGSVLWGRENGQALDWNRRWRMLLAMGAPLVVGWGVMLAYNKDVTGNWLTSPYQLYTDIYSPRHVYGFDNVVRGEQKLGPKVNQAYDRWAVNLTPELAAKNVSDRWLCSWLWTFDLLPQLLTTIVIMGVLRRIERRWFGILLAILSLHAVHVPYWYNGIMGWHYVFETAPLLCLCVGLATDVLCQDWKSRGRWLMPTWWTLLLMTSVGANFLPPRLIAPQTKVLAKVEVGAGSIQYPRGAYEMFNQWLASQVTLRPALVLIDADPDDQHMDYVVNSPGLKDPILRGRFLPGVTDIDAVKTDFSDRAIYLCRPDKKSIKLISPVQNQSVQ